MNQKRIGQRLRDKPPDLRTPEEKALWKEIRDGLAEKRRQDRLAAPEKLPDVWLYDSEHLLEELSGIREMIVRIPETLKTRSAIQSAIDRIWRVEQDLRFLLSLHRDGQRAFAQKSSQSQDQTTKKTKVAVPVQKIQSIRA